MPSEAPAKSRAEQDDEMALAVGRCLMAWAKMEMRLAKLFHTLLIEKPVATSDGILAAVRGFENKLKVVDAVLVRSDAAGTIRGDWDLLYNHADRLSRKRNQVAHATALRIDGSDVVLVPFFTLSKTNEHLTVSDVDQRADEFRELGRTFSWLRECALVPQGLSTKAPPPEPDLILRFREEAARRRAGKRHQHRPSQA